MSNKFFKTGITSALTLMCGFADAEKSPLTHLNKTNDQIAETRIVGGEEATQDNWPWMTAYVITFNELATSLSVNNVTYETRSFTSGVGGQASSEIMTCGIGDAVCTDATNKVCLIERGEVNFSEKADNCEAGGPCRAREAAAQTPAAHDPTKEPNPFSCAIPRAGSVFTFTASQFTVSALCVSHNTSSQSLNSKSS